MSLKIKTVIVARELLRELIASDNKTRLVSELAARVILASNFQRLSLPFEEFSKAHQELVQRFGTPKIEDGKEVGIRVEETSEHFPEFVRARDELIETEIADLTLRPIPSAALNPNSTSGNIDFLAALIDVGLLTVSEPAASELPKTA